MATDWQVGDLIQNRWQVYRILGGPGESGMGILYVVYDHELRDAYAAKTFQDDVFVRNPAIADRFTQEAITWISLEIHQNVTRARFVETIQGKPHLFLEYISGGDLGGWIGTPRLTEDLPQVLRFAIQFCDGMIHALSKGITAHRDIKPQNCLITEDKTLKVTDFGLAKVFDIAGLLDTERPDLESLSRGLTHAGMGMGTPPYMAPEQFDNAKGVDERADIYSFGVMLYQMLTGRLPFVGRTWEEYRRLHETQQPPSLIAHHSSLITVVQTCLAKDPAHRFVDFELVREQLVAVYQRLTGESAPPPVVGVKLDAMQLRSKGKSLYQLERNEEALACYDQALILNPSEAGLWSDKGAVLGRVLKREEEALACCDRALELDPLLEAAWSNRAGVLSSLGRTEEALACYDHALELDPHFTEALFNKAFALSFLDRIDEALICCNRALEISPYLDRAWWNKGILLWALGQTEEALACYDRTLELNPRDTNAWITKILSLRGLGRHEDALGCLDNAITFNPRDRSMWLQKGAQLSILGRIDEALVCYDRVLELNPDLDEAWLRKGIALGTLGRAKDALTCLNRTLELDSHNAEAWSNKGSALASLRQLKEANVCYDQALEINPNDETAWFNKGVIFGTIGQVEESLVCYDRALGLNPDYTNAWSNKGAALGMLGRREESLACYDRALEINPRYGDAWFNKAKALGELGRPEEALACYDHAIEVNPRDAAAWNSKGVVLVNAFHLFSEALPCFEEAQRLGHPRGAQAIAMCRLMLGE